MKFITLIITILTIILVTCNVNAGINVKPLDVERIQQYYDKNQTEFTSRCFYQNLCSDVEISNYKLVRDQLTTTLKQINPEYTVYKDSVWTIFE